MRKIDVKNFKIKDKILFGNIFLLLLIILVSLLLYFFQKDALLKNINNELLNTNNAIANMISSSARTTVKNYLRAISEKNLELAQYYYDEYKAGKLSINKSQEIIKNIFSNQVIGKTGYVYIIDSKGDVIFHPQKELVGTSLASLDFVKYQTKNRIGYTEYSWKNPDEKTEREKAAYTEYFAPFDWIIAVTSYRNEFINLIDPSDFKDDVISIKFGKTGYPFVLDLQGNIVIHPQVTGNWYNSVDSRGKYYVREICKKKTGQIYYLWRSPVDNVEREKLATFKYIDTLDWIVVSSSYSSEFYNPLTLLRYTFIFVFFLLVASLVFMNRYLNKHISIPITQLMSKIRNVTTTNDYCPLEVNAKDEIGIISQEMNIMIKTLSSQTDNLENLVESRTTELNRRLSEINELAEVTGALNKELQDEIVQHKLLESQMEEKTTELFILNQELSDKNRRLQELQSQIIQNVKMASLGQMAAGIAHEINNPVGFVQGNFDALKKYLEIINGYFMLSEEKMHETVNPDSYEDICREQDEYWRDNQLDFIIDDIPALIQESEEGLARVTNIVMNLKDFSRIDVTTDEDYDINEGIENTLIISRNEYRYVAEIDLKLGLVPAIKANGAEINEVILNLIINAAQAVELVGDPNRKKIQIRTYCDESYVLCDIEDEGPGISSEIIGKIFDPFFTTKEPGKGVGLGLSIAYNIVKKHGGDIFVESVPDKWTKFIVKLPIRNLIGTQSEEN